MYFFNIIRKHIFIRTPTYKKQTKFHVMLSSHLYKFYYFWIYESIVGIKYFWINKCFDIINKIFLKFSFPFLINVKLKKYIFQKKMKSFNEKSHSCRAKNVTNLREHLTFVGFLEKMTWQSKSFSTIGENYKIVYQTFL